MIAYGQQHFLVEITARANDAHVKVISIWKEGRSDAALGIRK